MDKKAFPAAQEKAGKSTSKRHRPTRGYPRVVHMSCLDHRVLQRFKPQHERPSRGTGPSRQRYQHSFSIRPSEATPVCYSVTQTDHGGSLRPLGPLWTATHRSTPSRRQGNRSRFRRRRPGWSRTNSHRGCCYRGEHSISNVVDTIVTRFATMWCARGISRNEPLLKHRPPTSHH